MDLTSFIEQRLVKVPEGTAYSNWTTLMQVYRHYRACGGSLPRHDFMDCIVGEMPSATFTSKGRGGLKVNYAIVGHSTENVIAMWLQQRYEQLEEHGPGNPSQRESTQSDWPLVTELHADFTSYCNERGVKPVGVITLGREVSKLLGCPYPRHRKGGSRIPVKRKS